MTLNKWSQAADQMLVARWNAGDTATLIAAALADLGMKVSRSAVLGRGYRLRLAGIELPARALPEAPRVRASKREKPVTPGIVLLDTEPVASSDDEPEPASAVTLPPLPPGGYRPTFRAPAEPAPTPFTGGPLRLHDPWPMRACRFPIFNGRITPTTPIFCGDPAAEGSRYCEHHKALVAPRSAVDPVRPSHFRLSPLVSSRKA